MAFFISNHLPGKTDRDIHLLSLRKSTLSNLPESLKGSLGFHKNEGSKQLEIFEEFEQSPQS